MHGNRDYVVDQYFYGRESLLVLKQPSCNLFLVGKECWRLFLTSKQDEWYWQIQRVLFTARVSQFNVNTMNGTLDQWSELHVAKCLIVHVVSSSYNLSSFELWTEKKTTQQWVHRVANDIVLYQVLVCHERVYADNVVGKFWFVSSFLSQHPSKLVANIATEKMSQFPTTEWKTRSFICKENLIFFAIFETI